MLKDIAIIGFIVVLALAIGQQVLEHKKREHLHGPKIIHSQEQSAPLMPGRFEWLIR